MAPSFPPLGEALDLGASPYSPWILESAVRLGITTTFRTAAQLLTHFTGVAMSAATIRRATEAAGTVAHHREQAFAAQVRDQGTVPPPAPASPLQLSLDGCLIHLRDEGWREVKVLAIGERQPGDQALQAITYAATLGSATQFGDEALGELARRGVPTAHDVVSVNDGAAWIQELLDLQCPQARRVLDFAHAASYLATAAHASWPDSEAVTTWFAAQRQMLLTGDPDQVLAALEVLPPSDERDTALGYLTTRRDQIAYRDFTAKGWPIGSGCVESAHQHVVQDRLKGRGMRWSRAGAMALVALRVANANDRWRETWRDVGPAQRADRRAGGAARRQDRQPAPSRPKVVVDGKPTIDHPWKQGLKRRLTSPLP